MITDAYLDDDRNLVLLPKHFFVQSIDDHGTPEDRFADSLLVASKPTGEKLTLDFSPFGDKVMLRSSNGRECPFLIRPMDDKSYAVSYDVSHKMPEACYGQEGKRSFVESLEGFPSHERLKLRELDSLGYSLLEHIEAFAKNNQLLCHLPNVREQAEMLVARRDFVYGKVYSPAFWQMICQQKQRALTLREHAPKLLYQSESFLVNSITQQARIRLYELTDDEKYLVTVQSLRGGVETDYVKKEIEGSYNRACGAFESACSRLGTRVDMPSREEVQNRKSFCRREADHRYALLQKARAMPANKRGGKEKFMALLAEGLDKDPLYYGEYAARKASLMGWQDKEIRSALRLYAPDAALDEVSKEMTFAEEVTMHKERSSSNFMQAGVSKGTPR